MKGVVAIQRRLLVLIYTLFTKNTPYDENYQTQKQTQNEQQKIRQTQNVSAETIELCAA